MNKSILINLNKIFTVNSMKKIVSGEKYNPYFELINYLSLDNLNNMEIIKSLYKYMNRNHRNEYFYKNTLLNKILLGKHSIRTSTAIRELPVDDCILDFLIINGVGHVYEIKTELDNLDRLSNQLNSYYKAFTYCNIVTTESKLKKVFSELKHDETGIIILTKRGTLHTVRKPKETTKYLDFKSIFDILRKKEFEEILNDYFGILPDVNDFDYYEECFKMFKKIDIKLAQKYLLKELKKREKVIGEKFQDVPKELKTLVYFSNYKDDDYNKLKYFLRR